MSAEQFFTWAGGPLTSFPGLLWRVALGLLLSAAIARVGYKRGLLSRSGFYGALAVGTIIFALGGWTWGFLLIAFFVTYSALSLFRTRQKQATAAQAAKAGRRDLGQALLTGGLGAVLAIASALTGGGNLLLFFAFVGAMAALNADAWATELGVLSRSGPHLITTGESVEPGTSGAISGLGLAASAAGAWFIGFLGLAFQTAQGWLSGTPYGPRLGWLPLFAALGGLLGSLLDSLLGATLQATYYCLPCGQETEQPLHDCGRQPIYLRGLPWLSSDWVNLFASLLGALVAAGLGWLALSA